MTNILIKHTVEDYERWKPHYDDHATFREEHGERGYRLFRTAADPNELVILFEWNDAEHARAFLESDDLRERMAAAGVVGEPEVSVLEEIEAEAPEREAA